MLQGASSPSHAATLDALAELALTAVQFLSLMFECEEVCTASGGGQATFQQLAREAQHALFTVCEHIQPDSPSTQLTTFGSIRSAVSLGAMLLHAEALLPQSLQAPARSSGGGSSSAQGSRSRCTNTISTSSTSNSSSSADVLQRLWKAVHKLEQRQLPATHQCLLCCLGVSMRAVAWAAAQIGKPHTSADNINAVAGTVHVLTQTAQHQQQQQQQQHEDTTDTGSRAGSQQGGVSAVLLQIEQHLGVSLLLLSTIQQQKQPLEGSWVNTCEYVTGAAVNAAATAHIVYETQWLGCSERSQQQLALQEMQRGMRDRYDQWVADTLPAALQLLKHLLQEADKVSQQHNAAAAAASSSGSSSSSSATTSAARVQGKPAAAAGNAAEVADGLQNVLLLLSMLARDFSAPVLGKTGLDASPFLQHADAWAHHSTELSTALDRVWRAHCRLGVFGPKLGRRIQLGGVMGPTKYEAPLLLAAVSAGPGSPQQVQLFSMLCSLFKLCGMYKGVNAEHADICVRVVIASAAVSLLDSGKQGGGAQMPAATPATAAVAAVPGAAQQAGSDKPVGYLPWLVLLGRCFMHWADQLQQLQQAKAEFGQLLLKATAASTGTFLAGGVRVPGGNRERVGAISGVHASHAVVLVVGSEEMRLCMVGACQSWLSNREWVDCLAAEGYPMQGIVQQTDAAIDALKVFAAVPDGDPAAAVAAYNNVVRQLRALGCVLTTLAVPHACNNPACSNMAGDTEVAAVSGCSCMCAGCLTARYCSRVCQTQHWKQHKPVCKALAAAAAASAAPAQPQVHV